MAIKYLSGNRVTALSTDLVTETTTELGYTGSSQAHVNSIHYKRFSATAGQKISKIGVRIYSCSDTKFKGGVFSDNGVADGSGQTGTARPSTLLSQGEITGITTSNANLWVEVDVDCTVPSNGLFWVGFISDDNSTNWYRDLTNTLASGGVYGSDCTPSGRWSNYANMMYSTANYGNGNNNQVSGNNVNLRYTISSNKLGTTSLTPTPTSSGGTLSPTSGSSVVLATTALGFTASNTWVLRFSTVFTTYNNNTYWLACLSNSDGDTQTSQNEMGSFWRKNSSENNFGVHNVEGARPDSVNSSDQITISPDTTTKYYWEIVRQGATSCRVNYYGTDSSYSSVTSYSENTSTSTVTSLDRIKFMSHTASNVTGSIAIADVEFYDGVTSASATDNAVTVPNGSVVEETNTGKHKIWNSTTSAWVEVG